MILINTDQKTYIDYFTLIDKAYIDIHFTNGSSRRIIFESDFELHTTVNKIVSNSRCKDYVCL